MPAKKEQLDVNVYVKKEPQRRSLDKLAFARSSQSWPLARRRSRFRSTELPIKQDFKPWDPIRHFRHQVAVVRQFVPAPLKWDRFLGNLGTGILGVRVRQSRCTSDDIPSPLRKRFDSGGIVGSIRNAKRFRKSMRRSSRLQPKSESFVFLFLNAGAARLQEWGGRMLAGFTPSLDRQKQELRWESQRSDKTGRVIQEICKHVAEGVEVVVAVRSGPGHAFTILGRTKEFSLDSAASFLPKAGDDLICEQGSARVHRVITAQCLDAALRTGIGLFPQRYPFTGKTGTVFCAGCCWKPATALLRFEHLGEQAAEILDPNTSKKQAGNLVDTSLPDKHIIEKPLRVPVPVDVQGVTQILLPMAEPSPIRKIEVTEQRNASLKMSRKRRVWRTGILEAGYSQWKENRRRSFLPTLDESLKARVARVQKRSSKTRRLG